MCRRSCLLAASAAQLRACRDSVPPSRQHSSAGPDPRARDPRRWQASTAGYQSLTVTWQDSSANGAPTFELQGSANTDFSSPVTLLAPFAPATNSWTTRTVAVRARSPRASGARVGGRGFCAAAAAWLALCQQQTCRGATGAGGLLAWLGPKHTNTHCRGAHSRQAQQPRPCARTTQSDVPTHTTRHHSTRAFALAPRRSQLPELELSNEAKITLRLVQKGQGGSSANVYIANAKLTGIKVRPWARHTRLVVGACGRRAC